MNETDSQMLKTSETGLGTVLLPNRMESQNRSGLERALAERSARSLSIVALLALAPVVLFALGRSALAVVGAVNVLLIFGSLYLATSPAEDGSRESHDAGTDEGTGESVA